MEFELSERVKGINPSATLAVDTKAKEMKNKGENVISFGAGEPDFDTPPRAKRAGIKAIREGFSKYTAVGGIIELKQAICEKLKRFKMDYEVKNVSTANGGKHILFNITQTLLNPGDEAVIFAPYWVTYEEQIKYAGGKPVIVKTQESNGFVPTEEEIAEAVNDKTKLIIFNSPSNPTGAVYPEKTIRKICDIALNHKAMIVSDEIYAEIYYGKKPVRVPTLSPEIKERTILADGASKSYSMTGWRVGYCACDEKIIKAMEKLMSHSTSNICSIAQKAAIAALEKDLQKKTVKEFKERRDCMMKAFKENGWQCFEPQGAFYAFPNISKFNMDSLKIADHLLEKAKVAVVPGAAFGCDENIRLSFATSMDNIVEGMNRINACLAPNKT